MRQKLLYISIILMCALACTRYNSNEVNKQLLQGKWIKTDVYQLAEDSVFRIQTPLDTTILNFDGDNCIEYMPDLDVENHFKYVVDNYVLYIYSNDTTVNSMSIETVSDDSLVLKRTDTVWKYKKME